MRTLLHDQVITDTTKLRRTDTMRRWLRGDKSANMAIEMYTGDDEDQSERHTKGHSSPAYYVKEDENNTLGLMRNGFNRQYRNYFDMGVGGDEAVERSLNLTALTEAESYFACDLAPVLADGAVKRARIRGFNTAPFYCDIFEVLPFNMNNSLMAVLGLTNQNLETYDNPLELKKRVIGIFKNYARALTSSKSASNSKSGLLIGWDANMNTREVKECYDNCALANLVRGCFSHEIPLDKFDYHVTSTNVKLNDDQEIGALATGLRARVAHKIEFDGEEFAIRANKFYPVLNSFRFNVPLHLDMLRQGGFSPHDNQRWTATGRVHYQHCTIG
jgi:hypothetical protein